MYIVQVWKAGTIVTSVCLNLATILVVGHFMSAKVSPERRLNLGFRTQKKCPFPLNRGVPSIQVTNTRIMWTFFRDQILCPLNGCVPWIEVSQRRGSNVVCHITEHVASQFVVYGGSYFLRISFCLRQRPPCGKRQVAVMRRQGLYATIFSGGG